VLEGATGGVTAEVPTSWLTRIGNFMGDQVCDEDADGLTYVTAEVLKALP
jgi:hypothetical protein